MNRAILLDRDGVLIEDVHLLQRPDQIRILPGVPPALRHLKKAGFQLHVLTNQAVVARGLLSEEAVRSLHHCLSTLLQQAGAPPIDGWFFCPHHPQATLLAYRLDCHCRKPRPGMFLEAATTHHLDLAASYAVGDRMTDIAAGARAGCRTVLVETGRHLDPLITTSEPLDPDLRPDHICANLPAAARWIIESNDRFV
ncbi:MAG TPA: HAD family hydrolase [Candidatus Paceibacterota bacterium]|nr:HAD family hydrolase [Verrucomicrobiota bacterium]HRY51027.1 HAD family hydrolase [Candidatus Paceibacterota bacterium]